MKSYDILAQQGNISHGRNGSEKLDIHPRPQKEEGTPSYLLTSNTARKELEHLCTLHCGHNSAP